MDTKFEELVERLIGRFIPEPTKYGQSRMEVQLRSIIFEAYEAGRRQGVIDGKHKDGGGPW